MKLCKKYSVFRSNKHTFPLKRNRLILLFLFSVSFLPGIVQAQDWYNSSWLYRKAITINASRVGSGTHTDFPVLINTADANLQTKARTDGNDILFTSADGITKLAHEIESYTSASGTLVAWVNIPSISSSANTTIYMYYGNAAAANQQNRTGTWDASFKGVYHLNNAFADATSNAYNGTNVGTTNVTGKISNGRSFARSNGDDYIAINGLMGSSPNITLSGWALLNSRDVFGANIINIGDHLGLDMDQSGNGTLGFAYFNSTWNNTKSNAYHAGTGWHYFAYTFDDAGNVQRLYIDGLLASTTNFTPSINYAGLGGNTRIGSHSNGNPDFDFDGNIDEVRVASAARSAGWIQTEYNNQNSPATFYSVGAEMCNPPVFPSLPTSGLIAQYNFSGNATDASGNGNNGTLQGGPTLVADRNGTAASAYSFNGTSQYISTTTTYTNLANVTYALWFKTTTTSGGRLIGMGTSQTGASNSYDRHIYMNNSGQLYFGVYPGDWKTVNTTQAYNDGQWHQVVASFSSTTGLKLYVDGSLKASDGSVLSAHSYTGTFRIGYDNLLGWPSLPASFYFNGVLDDISIFNRELTLSEITGLYNGTDGLGNNAPLCPGQTLSLTAPTLSGATYYWTGPNGFTSNLQNPTISNVTSANAGTYTVTATVNGCSSLPATTSVTIYAAPIVSGTSTPTCVGGSTGTITAAASGGQAPYTYSLDAGAYQSSTTFTGLAAGTYTLNVKNSTGCIASTTIVVSAFATATDNQNASGAGSWIGHVYDGTAFNNYIGQYTLPETFNESFGGATVCLPLTSNGASRSIYTETFSVRYRMSSTKSGLYVVDLGSDDGSRLTVDNTVLYNNWLDQGFVSRPRVLVPLTGSSSLLYEFYENGGGNQVAFQNLTLVLANNLSGNTTQSICVGGIGVPISGDAYGTLPTGISLSGTGYQWSYSTSPGGPRIDIAGATGATFTPSASTGPFNSPGTYYIFRKAVLSSSNNISPNPYVATHESNAATIVVTAPPSATISYGASVFCFSNSTKAVTRTGTAGGTYSAGTGLAINASTGEINIGNSTPGSYTITYTIAASGGCGTYTTTTNIQIMAPLANNQLSYANGLNGVLCATANENGTASLTAPAGTVFTTVQFASYGTPSGSCSAFAIGACHASTSQPVVESYLLGNNTAGIPATNAIFSDPCSGTVKRLYVQAMYTQPVCSGTSPGTIAGTLPTGGDGNYTYLWEVSTTGSSSGFTPAPGTNNTKDYVAGILSQTIWLRRTVTSGTCSNMSNVIQVTVIPAPTATISYSASPYCGNSGTATVTRTGTAGGTYSAAAGLAIDANTGAINLASSTPGTYTVSYTASSGGCSVTATTSVTITPAPFANGTYIGSPYCSTSGFANPSGSASGAGVFSAPAGLSINASTGVVNLGASTPGTYTVTFTIPASGGCSEFVKTTNITILAPQTASVSIAASATFICSGSQVTFTATSINGGTSPGYQWKVNGLSVGTNSPTYVSNSLTNGDIVSCVLTSNYSCLSGSATVSSNAITLNISTAGTWTGATSTSWSTASNWECGIVPTAAIDVVIPAGTNYSPVITAASSVCRNLTIQTGATLTLANDARFSISGNISNNGTFNAENGIIVMSGSSEQTIPANCFSSNTIKSLTINNSAGVVLSGALNLTDVLTVTAGSLASNGHLTLKSSATATARVAPITSNAVTPISGAVTVERYVPGKRKYRLITSSVTTSTKTALSSGEEAFSIWGNWQNSGINTTPNAGNLITGGSDADGFDQQTTNASLFTYDAVNRKYTGFTTTNGKNTKFTPLKAGVAYYMFVYGDRRNSVIASTIPNNTVLSAKGTLKTGNQVYTTNSEVPLSNVVGRFTLLGNPFASPIDWASLQRTDLSNTMWGWDPNLSSTGGYVTITTTGSVTLTAPYSGAVGLDQYIQSGQGFFVQTTGSSPSLTIREQDKVNNFNANAFRTFGRVATENTIASRTVNDLPLIAVNLQYEQAGTKVLADGVLAAFDASFAKEVGTEDAVKMSGSNEVLSIANGSELLSIDGRKLPTSKDTLQLNAAKLSAARQYTMQIFTKKLGSDMQVFLEDNYKQTLRQLLLNDTNSIAFNVVSSDPLSSAADRFKIVFAPAIPLPVRFVSVKAEEKNNGVQVSWNVAEESGIKRYETERSADGIHFIKQADVLPQPGGGTQSYTWLDAQPVTSSVYYRVRAVEEDGTSSLSKVVLVKAGDSRGAIQVSPNPVIGKQIHLQLVHLEKGKYTIRILNAQGQLVSSQTIEHAGGSNIIALSAKKLAAGVYHLQLTNGKIKYEEKIIIE